jgi:hypothetical protein
MGLLDDTEAWNTAEEQWKAFKDGLDDTDQEGRDLTRTLADIITTAEDIPAEKKTDLLLKLQQGDVDEVYAIIKEIEKKRYMRVGVRFDDSAAGIIKPPKGGGLVGKATGGPAGGRTLVGEAGPEIVDLPEGSYVNTAKRSEQMLKGEPATPYVDNRTFNILVPNQTPEATARAVERAARRNGR